MCTVLLVYSNMLSVSLVYSTCMGLTLAQSLCRWVFGLFFCITVALTLLAIVGGLFCGLVGSSNRRLPYERTKLSNCGGVSLLA